MSASIQTQFVSRYLTNFFAEATEDEITSVLSEINPAIIQVMSTLIEHDVSMKEIVDTTSTQIKNLEDKIISRDNQIKNLKEELSKRIATSSMIEPVIDENTRIVRLEKLKMLRSATYNAKLYLICEEIFKRYLTLNQPISLRQIHKEFGQNRIITSFKQQLNSKSSPISKLIGELFTFESKNSKLMVTPSALGMSVYQLNLEYYSPESILKRFDNLLLKNKLANSKKILLKQICISQMPFTNNTIDKNRIATFCGIHKDNISKYLIQLVKFGFINRIPDEFSNNLFTYQCFNDKIIEKL